MITKFAVIGCGAISELWHIPAAVALLGKENISLVDSDVSRAEIVAKRFGIASRSTALSELKASLDAVLIAAPPKVHLEVAEKAFASGLHVLCEKPLANSVKECESMLRAARASGRTLGVCHTYRLFPNRVRVRDILNKGEFGTIKRITLEQGSPASWPTLTGYSFRKDMVPGGVFLNEGIHSLDFLFWLGAEPVHSTYIDDSLGGLESNAEVNMVCKNGLEILFRVSRTSELANIIRIECERGQIEIGLYDMDTFIVTESGVSRKVVVSATKDDFSILAKEQLKDFLAAVNEARLPMCPGEDGMRAVSFIEHCYLQKRKKPLPAKVPVPGFRW